MQWINSLGLMTYPLAACSFFLIALVCERLLIYLRYLSFSHHHLSQIQLLILESNWVELQEILQEKDSLLDRGTKLLLHHREHTKDHREEILHFWLTQQKGVLFTNLKAFSFIATLSPMLGLLGTILGIIHAFQNIASHQGAVTPHLLADGLWEAMLTTAVGLGIAIPALLASYGLRTWAKTMLDHTHKHLNLFAFALEGIQLFDPCKEKEIFSKSSLMDEVV